MNALWIPFHVSNNKNLQWELVSLILHSKIKVLIHFCGARFRPIIVLTMAKLYCEAFPMFKVNTWGAEKKNAEKSCVLLHYRKKRTLKVFHSLWDILWTKFSRKSSALVHISGFVIVIPTLVRSQLAFKATVYNAIHCINFDLISHVTHSPSC